MPRDSRDIIRRLERGGFELVSVAGSHHKFVHSMLRKRIIIPRPKRDLPVGTVRAIYRDAGWKKDWMRPAKEMAHFIALIHKDADSCYGISFPDVPGVFTAGDTIDEVLSKAAEVLEFAAEDWSDLNGDKFPVPRTIDELRSDPDFQEQAVDAVIATVPFQTKIGAAA